MELAGQQFVLDPRQPLDIGGPAPDEAFELAAADQAEAELGQEVGRGEDRLEPVQRDELPDEERGPRLVRRPARGEETLLRADEADLDVSWRCLLYTSDAADE